MRHLFRLNVAGQGYVLYAGEPGQGFKMQPLDQASAAVPAGYLAAQRRLDQLFETRQVAWSVSFQRVAAGARPVLAYGGWLAAADQRGRPGLVFLHAVELDADALYPCAAAVVTQLAPTAARQLSHELTGLAAGKGGVPLAEFLQRIAAALEACLQKWSVAGVTPAAPPRDVAVVEHDCAGAAAVAWLTMAALRGQSPGPWEVFEQLGKHGQTETHTVPSRGRAVPASQLLLQSASAGQPSQKVVSSPSGPVPSLPPATPAPVVSRRPSRGALVIAVAAALGLVASLVWNGLQAQHLTDAEADLVARERQRTDSERQAGEAERQVAELKTVLSKTAGELDTGRNEAGEAKRRAGETQIALTKTAGERDTALKKVDETKAMVVQLTNDLTRTTGERDAARKELNATKTMVAQLTNELTNTKTARDAIQKELNETKLRVVQLTNDLTKTVGERDTAQKQLLSHQATPFVADAGGDIHRMAFSPDGKCLASRDANSVVKRWSVPDGKPLQTFQDNVWEIAYSLDGDVLAAAAKHPGAKGEKGWARLWNLTKNMELFSLEVPVGKVKEVVFSRTGGELASAGEDGTVHVRGLKTGPVSLKVGAAVSAVAFSPDGKWLAVCCVNGSVYLSDWATGKTGDSLPSRNVPITSVAFHPTGKQLAVAGEDGRIEVWDAATRKPAFGFQPHAGAVRSVAFSKDGQWLASGGQSGTLCLWDAARGHLVRVWEHGSTVGSVAFRPDDTLASGGSDKKILLWSPPTRR